MDYEFDNYNYRLNNPVIQLKFQQKIYISQINTPNMGVLGILNTGQSGISAVTNLINKTVSFVVIDAHDKKPLQATVKVSRGFGLLNNYGIRQSMIFDAWVTNEKNELKPNVISLPIGYYNYEITVDGYDGTITGRFLLKDNTNIPIMVRTR